MDPAARTLALVAVFRKGLDMLDEREFLQRRIRRNRFR